MLQLLILVSGRAHIRLHRYDLWPDLSIIL